MKCSVMAKNACIMTGLLWLSVSNTPLAHTHRKMPTTKVLFASFEGSKIHLYSSHLNGSNRKLLMSQETGLINARPLDGTIAKVSPKGDLIAYKIPGHGYAPVFVMDPDGQNKRKIIDEAQDFYWLPDAKSVLYAAPLPKPNPMQEQSIQEDGYEWHTINLRNGHDGILAPKQNKFHMFGSWLNEGQALFISYWGFGAGQILYLFDMKTKKMTGIELPKRPPFITEVSTSPSSKRTIVLASLGPYPCVFYELKGRALLETQTVANNHRCEGVGWNGDDEFFYGMWLGLPGGQTSARGSIYRYNFKTKKNEAVLTSDGKELYRFQNVLNGKLLVLSNESNKRTPAHILETRKLDGSNPVTIFSSDQEILFVGWLQ